MIMTTGKILYSGGHVSRGGMGGVNGNVQGNRGSNIGPTNSYQGSTVQSSTGQNYVGSADLNMCYVSLLEAIRAGAPLQWCGWGSLKGLIP